MGELNSLCNWGNPHYRLFMCNAELQLNDMSCSYKTPVVVQGKDRKEGASLPIHYYKWFTVYFHIVVPVVYVVIFHINFRVKREREIGTVKKELLQC